MESSAGFAWNLFCELRQEVREAQKIRAQVIGFKIAFVTASLGFVFAQRDRLPNFDLLLVPAFASIFFDYLIISYGYSIKRIGYYCRVYLEPKLRPHDWPSTEPLWEQAMSTRQMRQHFATTGNLGLSICTSIPASAHLLLRSSLPAAWLLAILLFILLAFDLWFGFFWKYAPPGKLSWPPEEPQKRVRLDSALRS